MPECVKLPENAAHAQHTLARTALRADRPPDGISTQQRISYEAKNMYSFRMQEGYGYLERRSARLARRRRRNRFSDVFAVVLLVCVVAGLVYGALRVYGYLRPAREDYSTWALHRAREIVELGNAAASLRGSGKAAEFAKRADECRSLDTTIAAAAYPDDAFEEHAALYMAASLLSRAASEAASHIDYLPTLTEARKQLLFWRERAARRGVSERQLASFDIDLSRAAPKPALRPTTQKKARRGVALISFTTLPRPEKKLSGTVYLYAVVDMMAVTVEVQNQGETTETSVPVTLTIRSSKAGEIGAITKSVENLKPGERKPVTFENVLPDTSPDVENTIRVVAGPVPGESYLLNNEKTITIRWK